MIFPPEFRLALDCCRGAFRGAPRIAAIPTEVDWARFLRLVCFHRIEGLAWNTLSGLEIPESVGSALRSAASDIAVHNLHASAQSAELLRRFEAADIPLLFLKGMTLSAIAYDNPALKSIVDIDLLIDPGDLEQGVALLRELGFQLEIPGSRADLRAWHRHRKESVWTGSSPALQIDLHTRTADSPRLIPEIGVHSPRQLIEIGSDIALPTFALDELFAYLAVHGASSAWFRLKWIADFAGFVLRLDGPEIDRLYRRSQQLGAGRAAGQALMLADSFFDILSPVPSLRSQLMRDRATRLLWRTALRLLTGEPREPTAKVGGTFTIHWTQFLLLPGVPYKLSELWRQARRLA